jgi:hypothetical protein
MRRAISVLILISGISFLFSCTNSNNTKNTAIEPGINHVYQKPDGSIELQVKKADCYSDKVNPSTNTAEWNVSVKKSGRFNVWLSSATTDTTNLEYRNKVLLNVHDNVLEAQPGIDKVIRNSSEVDYPYFRADSFMGSLYIQDTGLYAVQIISDRILPESEAENAGSEKTKLLSVFLTPVVR